MSDHASISRQSQRDAEYRQIYEAWLEALPKEERSKLRAMGLNKPMHDDFTVAGHGTEDAASYASCGWPEREDDGADDDTEIPTAADPAPVTPPTTEDDERTHDLLRRLLGEVISQSNISLSMDCLALVTGLLYEGDSMTEIAKRHRISRAAVSKRCIELTFALKLKPSRAMRTMLARENSRQTRLNLMKFLLP